MHDDLFIFVCFIFFFLLTFFYRRKVLLQQNEQRIAANQAALNQVGGLQHMPGMATPTSGPRGLGCMSPAPQNIPRPRKILFCLHHLFLFEFILFKMPLIYPSYILVPHFWT